jgi:hypothetical protein
MFKIEHIRTQHRTPRVVPQKRWNFPSPRIKCAPLRVRHARFGKKIGGQLGGQVRFDWRDQGLICEIALPLQTPQRAAD